MQGGAFATPKGHSMNEFPPSGTRDDVARSMVELIRNLARALVDNPEQVEVEAILDSDSTLLRLRVAQADLGKVIGKQGRTARSIRTILGAASMKAQHRFALDIQQHGLAREPLSSDLTESPEA